MLDVRNKSQKGILLGDKGRIIQDVRERAEQILSEQI